MPTGLAGAIDEVLGRRAATTGVLTRAAENLSARYRDGCPTPLQSDDEVDAYLATRLPATAAAIGRVMDEVRERWAGFAPATQLDLGAGPGAAAWAAARVWPDIGQVVLVDRDARMVAAGQALAHHGDPPAFDHWDWRRSDITVPLPQPLAPADLVTAAYVLGELAPEAVRAVTTTAWNLTSACLILVEPGTPAGFQRIRAVRAQLLSEGAHLIAPCPHEGPCPIQGNDWCHFAARVSRSATHRRLKGAELGFEDEKFSYVAFARHPGAARRVDGRVVRRPMRRRRFIELPVCVGDEITAMPVGQSHPLYREAARLRWGDAAPAELWRRSPEPDAVT